MIKNILVTLGIGLSALATMAKAQTVTSQPNKDELNKLIQEVMKLEERKSHWQKALNPDPDSEDLSVESNQSVKTDPHMRPHIQNTKKAVEERIKSIDKELVIKKKKIQTLMRSESTGVR